MMGKTALKMTLMNAHLSGDSCKSTHKKMSENKCFAL